MYTAKLPMTMAKGRIERGRSRKVRAIPMAQAMTLTPMAIWVDHPAMRNGT